MRCVVLSTENEFRFAAPVCTKLIDCEQCFPQALEGGLEEYVVKYSILQDPGVVFLLSSLKQFRYSLPSFPRMIYFSRHKQHVREANVACLYEQH